MTLKPRPKGWAGRFRRLAFYLCVLVVCWVRMASDIMSRMMKRYLFPPPLFAPRSSVHVCLPSWGRFRAFVIALCLGACQAAARETLETIDKDVAVPQATNSKLRKRADIKTTTPIPPHTAFADIATLLAHLQSLPILISAIMFSPDPQAQSTANAPARNSRRRQRDSDGDTMRKPQRKRSKLSEDTYRPPRGEPSDAEIRVMNGHPKNGSREMPVREKKREPGKRGSLRMDSSTVLVCLRGKPKQTEGAAELTSDTDEDGAVYGHAAVCVSGDAAEWRDWY